MDPEYHFEKKRIEEELIYSNFFSSTDSLCRALRRQEGGTDSSKNIIWSISCWSSVQSKEVSKAQKINGLLNMYLVYYYIPTTTTSRDVDTHMSLFGATKVWKAKTALHRHYDKFNGDTFLDFLKMTHHKFPRCYIFMDKASRRIINQRR